ncbi:MAG: tetratricopeptide repeat protein [Acidobacteria bacterium]|nr:tetratricopeptide repeat protein [Acidobacteriota bacterium]
MMVQKKVLFTACTIGMIFCTYGLLPGFALPSVPQIPTSNSFKAKLPDGEGRQYVQTLCTSCHDLERVVNQLKNLDAWTATVSDMLGRISPNMEKETAIISDYLTSHYGVVTSAALTLVHSSLKQDDLPAAESLIRENVGSLGQELTQILEDMDRGFDELGRQKARYDVLQDKFSQFQATWMPYEDVFRLFSSVTDQPGFSKRFQAKRLRIEGARHTTRADYFWDRQEYGEALQEYDHGIKKLQAAIPLAEAVNDQKLVAACLTNIGYNEIYSGNSAEGLRVYSQALQIAEQRHDDVFQGMYLLNLGTFHLYTMQPQEALDYALRAAEMNRKIGRRTWEANALLNVGATYLSLRKKEEAHSYLQKALLKAEEAKDRRSTGRILFNQALVTTQMGLIEEAARLMEEALEWYSEYNVVYSQAETALLRYQGVRFLVSTYQKLKNPEKVKHYASQVKELLSEDPQKLRTYLEDPHLNFLKWEKFRMQHPQLFP